MFKNLCSRRWEKHVNYVAQAAVMFVWKPCWMPTRLHKQNCQVVAPPHKPRLQTVINSPPQQIWLGVYVKGHLQHRLFSFSGVMPIHISLGHVPPLVWINHPNHSSVSYLVGGLEHFLFFPSYWEFHNPN